LGIPKIADFGLAKRLQEEPGASTPAGQTQSGAILGTPSYMAPEQAAGHVHEIGPVTDVYALGVILYECLAGRPPFKANALLDTLQQIMASEPVPPGRLQPGVPRDLDTICLKCLRKEPGQRYASALELADDLQRFLNDEPIRARQVGVLERARKWARRRPALAGSLAVAVLLLLGGLAGGLWYWDAYLRTKTEYYNTFIRRWGAPEGVGRLTEDQARARYLTYRFRRRAGRVLRVEVINGHGVPIAVYADISNFDNSQGPWKPEGRESVYEYSYGADGRVTEETARDRHGQVVWTFHYTTPTTGHFTDARGFSRSRPGSGAAYIEFVWTADGLPGEVWYLDRTGNRQPDPNGIYGRRTAFDQRGLPREMTLLGRDGRPGRSKDGVTRWTARCDERGNVLEQAFFDARDRPTLEKSGYARWTGRYDANGNRAEVTFYGVDGKPALTPFGCARWRGRFDAHGNFAEMAFFDTQDRPITTTFGFHRYVLGYDDRGNCTEETYFGVDGRIAMHRDGCARVRSRFDDRANEVERAFFGTDGKPVLLREGFARWTARYDRCGNQTARAYFGVDGRPTLHREGCARLESRYDVRGNEVECAYFGTDGKPALLRDGYARWTARYDEHDNQVERAYFDRAGRATLNKDGGYHRWTDRYDERNNLVETAFRGGDGRLVRHRRLGYARAVFTWNAANQQTDAAYFDEAEHRLRTQVVVHKNEAAGAGAKAGLQPGDVLLTYGGSAVVNVPRLALLRQDRANRGQTGRVELRVRRGSGTMILVVAPLLPGVELEDRAVPEGQER
jgi:hypothetical protein